MSKELQELLSANLKEGVEVDLSEYLDLEKANESYNNHINGIVTKNTAKAVEKAKGEYTSQFIKELGIEAEDLDGVKLWAKKMNGNTDEFKETNMKLEKELNEIREKYELTQTEYNNLKSELVQTSQIKSILAKGYDQEEAEFIQFKLNKQVTEEKSFDELLEEYAKEEQPKTKTTQRYTKPKFTGGDEVSDSIKKRYPKYFK